MKIRGQTVYSAKERIERMIRRDPASGCWNWRTVGRGGYGRLMVGSRALGTRRTVSAHRFSYETFIGPIPPEMECCHHCDNRKCVNPEHLFIGTKQDNMDDRERKGRNKPQYGEANGQTKLTSDEVAEIKRSNKGSRALASEYGVDKKTIYAIQKGLAWKHVIIPPPPTPQPEEKGTD